MAKGNPNDSSMQLNFVAKVWDETAGDYRPIYIAPDATDAVQGDVYLSDAINGTDDAAKGVTAATPKAVKTAYDSAVKNNITTAQTMQSDLTPKTNNTLSLGTNALKWANIYATTIHGTLDGNASSASKLDHTVKFSIAQGNAGTIEVNSDLSNGSNVNFNLSKLDASTLAVGTVPIERLPKGALERLIHVPDQAARFNLTTDTVQLGDTVQQDDTKVMYIVTDESKLNSAAGYTEYYAGTAIQASKLTPGATIQTNLESESAVNFTGEGGVSAGVTGTLPVKHGGTGTAELSQYGVLVGNGTNSVQSIGSINTGAVYKDSATANPKIGILPVEQGGTSLSSNPEMIVDLGSTDSDAVFQDTPQPGVTGVLAVTNGGTGTATGVPTNNNPGLVPNLPTGDETEQMFLNGNNEWKKVVTEIADGSITTEKLADAAVDLTKLGIDVETIYIGSKKPTDDNIKLWINPEKETDADLTEALNKIVQSVRDEIKQDWYPVGTILRFTKEMDPASIYGGTWELNTSHDFQGVYIYTKIED